MNLLTSKIALFKLELSSCPSLLTRQLCTGGSEEEINVTALSLSFGRQIKILSPENYKKKNHTYSLYNLLSPQAQSSDSNKKNLDSVGI